MSEYIINEGGVNRKMTKTEIVEYEQLCADVESRVEIEQQKIDAKTELFKKLGITADEAILLLS